MFRQLKEDIACVKDRDPAARSAIEILLLYPGLKAIRKTNYMLFESVVTNTIYYGIAFVLYATGVWTPTLIGIALLFGIGNAFDSIVSLGAFACLLKKEKINILNV